MKIVLWKQDNGIVACTFPAPGFDVEHIAKITTPKGKPYYIVDKDVIPKDLTFRNAWELDESGTPDGVGEA